jgi:hypothetical protein
MITKRRTLGLCWLLLAGLACSDEASLDQGVPVESPAGKTEGWNPYADNPDRFAGGLVYELASLPLSGEAKVIPWAGSYWPIASDGINYPWAGPSSEPATTKFGRAFGVTGVEDAVSRLRGVDSYSANRACQGDSQCNAARSEVCGKRAGQPGGYCIPSWEGICNGWTPASILEPEPQNPVTWNNVTFRVNDIKALASLAYYRTEGVTIGSRCMTNASSPWMSYDEYGRPVEMCRDTNAGTWHVIATNFLGLRKRSFAEDRTWDVQVWNQPLRGYEITHQQEVSAAQANALIGVTATGGDVESFTGAVARDEWRHHGPFTVEAGAGLRAKLGGTGDADLYLRVGQKPTAHEYDCRPYIEGSRETCEVSAPSGSPAKVHVAVRGYAPQSSYSLSVTSNITASKDYVFNEGAARLFHVKMKAHYIAESDPRTDGPLADQIDDYTHTDRYEYVLEVDAQGKVIGGEWVGASKKLHPDFLWLPDRPSEWDVASRKIAFGRVKALLNLSAHAGQGTPVVKVQEVDVPKGGWVNLGPFRAGAGKLVVYTTGDGEADLFVRRGAMPTSTEHDCYPRADPAALSIGSTELCVVDGSEDIYVSLYGWAPSSRVKVEISYVELP